MSDATEVEKPRDEDGGLGAERVRVRGVKPCKISFSLWFLLEFVFPLCMSCP